MNNILFYANGKTNKRMKTTRPSGAVRYWVVSNKTAWEIDSPAGSQIGPKFDVSSIFGTKYADQFSDEFRKANEIKNSTPSKLANPTKSTSDDSDIASIKSDIKELSAAVAALIKNQS